MTSKKIKTPLDKLREKAWKLMSEYVRLVYADWRGLVPCFTCFKIAPVKEMQAGHYKHKYQDFNMKNIHPQCDMCNRWSYGRPDVYKQQLIRKYGEAVILELDEAVKEEKQRIDKLGYSYTEQELEKIIDDLKQKIARL